MRRLPTFSATQLGTGRHPDVWYPMVPCAEQKAETADAEVGVKSSSQDRSPRFGLPLFLLVGRGLTLQGDSKDGRPLQGGL